MSTSEQGALRAALGRADRRRRLRGALRSSLGALWLGLAAGIPAAAMWRLTDSGVALAAAAAAVVISLAVGALIGRRAPDLRAAAVELDRTLGHDAALLTGLEIQQGVLGGVFADAAARDAERLALGIDPSDIRIEPTARARYLAIPAALLAVVVLLPRDERTTGHGWASALDTPNASASVENTPPLDGGPRDIEHDTPTADRAHVRAALDEEADAADRAQRAVEQLKPPAPKGDPSARRGPAPGASGINEEAGAGSGSDMVNDEAPALGGGGSIVDDFEEAIAGERFGAYADLVQRYFAGRNGLTRP